MQTKLEAGLEYEIYVKNIIKHKYKNTWLWTELPKDILFKIGCIKNITDKCDDIGCDIVCQYHDDTFVFIQCKNYSTNGVAILLIFVIYVDFIILLLKHVLMVLYIILVDCQIKLYSVEKR